MEITFESSGSFKNTENFLNRISKNEIAATLDKYGAIGTAALRAATPMDTGLTANSWSHQVRRSLGSWSVTWYNQNGSGRAPIAIMLQYGHGTGTGGYVAGRDYINPAIQPVFDKIAEDVWREVTRK